jgi:D-glycero-D-manno-heptose 1,7-bisphosphate phosphatase
MSQEKPERKAVFLDRDGVLNRKIEGDYVRTPSQFVWLDGAREGVLRLNKEGWIVVLITNQRGVARGLMTLADVVETHRKMQCDLAEIGAHVDAIYVCPHENNECSCRKPEPGLILKAAKEWKIDLGASLLIGDSGSDIEAARRAGVRAWRMPTDGNLLSELEKALHE